MDSVTQAALGAAIGGAVLGKHLGRAALLGGALLATVPDLDVLIDFGDAVANYTEHRGFSHSLLVLTPLALALAALLSRWRPQVDLGRWCAFTLLALLTHPLLDALTTYGTQLFWPFGAPVNLSSIYIIDPFYTVPLLIAIAWACWRPAGIVRTASLGLLISSLYLGWGLAAQQWATHKALPVLTELGIDNAPRLVQPMPMGTLLWRVTSVTEETQYELVVGLLDGNKPITVQRFPRNPALAAEAATLPDNQRLQWFAGDFLHYEEHEGQLLVTDIRLGMPGSYPFTFVIAERQAQGWHPIESTRQPMQLPDLTLLMRLLRRALVLDPVFCLGSLELASSVEVCS